MKAVEGELKTVEVKAFVPSKDFALCLSRTSRLGGAIFRPKHWFLTVT
jgi:hypothetical protein